MASYSWHNVPWLRTQIVNHRQKVQSLYKRACRTIDDWYLEVPHTRADALYRKTILRARFDANKDIKDLRKAKVLLLDGEQELWDHLHPVPLKFGYSPGGICFERYPDVHDHVLDFWDPREKAKFPEYFAKREQGKIEYAKMFEEKWGVHPAVDLGVTHHLDVEDPKTDEEKMYGKNGHFGTPVTDKIANEPSGKH